MERWSDGDAYVTKCAASVAGDALVAQLTPWCNGKLESRAKTGEEE
jgi:hypothetical protein